MSDCCCFDCRFYEPDSGSASALSEKDWREDLPGDCRGHAPVVGDLVTHSDGDPGRRFGEPPRVMASMWCGEFTLRPRPSKHELLLQ